MGGKKPLRRPLWPPTRATASNYYPLGLDGAGGAAKPLLRAPKKPAPLHGRLPAFSGAVDAFERARKCFLEWRYFFSIILSEFLKNRVALHSGSGNAKDGSNICHVHHQGQFFQRVILFLVHMASFLPFRESKFVFEWPRRIAQSKFFILFSSRRHGGRTRRLCGADLHGCVVGP